MEDVARLLLQRQPPRECLALGAGLGAGADAVGAAAAAAGCCHPVVLGVLASLADDVNVRAAPLVEVQALHALLGATLPHLAAMLSSLPERAVAPSACVAVLRAELAAVLSVLRFVCSPSRGAAAAAAAVEGVSRHGVRRSALVLWLNEEADAALGYAVATAGASSLGHFLLSCVWTSEEAASFVSRVPQVTWRVESAEFAQTAPAYAVLWPMLLAVCTPTAPAAPSLRDTALGPRGSQLQTPAPADRRQSNRARCAPPQPDRGVRSGRRQHRPTDGRATGVDRQDEGPVEEPRRLLSLAVQL